MSERKWHPISMLRVIAALSDEQFANANEQYATLSRARDRPHVLTDEIVGRVLRLYTSQREELPLDREQHRRWRKLELSHDEMQEIERLEKQSQEIEVRIGEILALMEEVKSHTIDQVLAKSDGELGLEALMRPIDPQDLKAARQLLSTSQFEAALGIDTAMKTLLAEGCDEMVIFARMFDHMEPFKRLVDSAPRAGLDLITTRFAGFFMFAKLLEGLAEDIASGAIKVPPAH